MTGFILSIVHSLVPIRYGLCYEEFSLRLEKPVVDLAPSFHPIVIACTGIFQLDCEQRVLFVYGTVDAFVPYFLLAVISRKIPSGRLMSLPTHSLPCQLFPVDFRNCKTAKAITVCLSL